MADVLLAVWQFYGSDGVRAVLLVWSFVIAVLISFFGLGKSQSSAIKAMIVHHRGWCISAGMFLCVYAVAYFTGTRPDWPFINQIASTGSLMMAIGSTWLLLWLYGKAK